MNRKPLETTFRVCGCGLPLELHGDDGSSGGGSDEELRSPCGDSCIRFSSISA